MFPTQFGPQSLWSKDCSLRATCVWGLRGRGSLIGWSRKTFERIWRCDDNKWDPKVSQFDFNRFIFLESFFFKIMFNILSKYFYFWEIFVYTMVRSLKSWICHVLNLETWIPSIGYMLYVIIFGESASSLHDSFVYANIVSYRTNAAIRKNFSLLFHKILTKFWGENSQSIVLNVQFS